MQYSIHTSGITGLYTRDYSEQLWFPLNEIHQPQLLRVNQGKPQLQIKQLMGMYMSGTKIVANELKKIAQGANKWEGVNWFQQLTDKRKYRHVVLYLYIFVYESIVIHVHVVYMNPHSHMVH